MAKNDIRTIVMSASKEKLDGRILLYGNSTYTLATNHLSWDGDKLFTLEQIGKTFGLRASGISNNDNDVRIQCGKDTISVYDFGLIYSALSAVVMSAVELGTTVPVEHIQTNKSEYKVAWFGNDGIIYNIEDYLIIPIKNTDTYNICVSKRAVVRAFTNNNTYEVDLDVNKFILSKDGTILCRFSVPTYVTQTYRSIFDGEVLVDDPDTPWDETSMLGSLVYDSGERTDISDVALKYKTQSKTYMNQAVMREDLIFKPVKRFEDVNKILGSWAYTDNNEIVMPINEHTGLLAYTESRSLNDNMKIKLKYDVYPEYSKFFDVSEEFTHIMRFANCVNNRPLTAAALDQAMYTKIKEAFKAFELSRVSLPSTFGRIVIPEDVLLRELSSKIGDALFCIVPVGMIGDNLIVLNSEGNPETVTGYTDESIFYDVTSIVN